MYIRGSDFSRRSLVMCAAAAVLAGCGGSQSLIGVSGAAAARFPSPATKLASSGFKPIYSFEGEPDGQVPNSDLVEVNGTLYGTTFTGGSGCASLHGCGTVFKITASGAEDVVYRFSGKRDGAFPSGDLVNVNGTLYGVTNEGGASNEGIVFSVTTSGDEKVLHSFDERTDGAYPTGLTNVNGTLYGLTQEGGTYGAGTVFNITTSGSEDVIYGFGSGSGSDGFQPIGSLINVKGVLYGATEGGGTGCQRMSGSGCGTVFAVTTSGAEHVVYSFEGKKDGALPRAGLTALNGVLFGTTSSGGISKYGTVFKVTTSGLETVLHRFTGEPDGRDSTARLVAIGGALYGTTYYGGSGCGAGYGCGTIFTVSTSGAERVLRALDGRSDGYYPEAGLTSVKGKLYGTAAGGGTNCYSGSNDTGCGTVFSMTPLRL
ncbi:MAG: choice-of-anchor tandem repeat GloVer-containing protein [Candidatus Cybelea sp.]